MNKWKVVLTPEFQEEVRDIYSYIANTLLVPETAVKQVRRIMDAVETLNEMPLRYPLYEKKPWNGRGLRKLVVDNFVVFYLPNEKAHEVVILHAFYGGRNIEELL
jgi:toxin ParE1/3/4